MTIQLAEPGVQRWLGMIAAYDKEFAPWIKRAQGIADKYTDKKALQRKTSKVNLLWSNVQTLVPAVFSRLPKPDVSRRFRDNDPVGRVAALLLERALDYEIEHYPDYRHSMREAVQDRFLGGRGTTWVRYEPHMRQADMPEGVELTEDQEAPEVIDYECAPVDYVHWRDFGHNVARTWEEVTTIWRKVYMGRDALIARFGEELGSQIPLDTKPEELKKSGTSSDSEFQAVIHEIWDMPSKRALWLSKSLGKIVDERADPLELEGFWPTPKPLFATLTTDSLVPVPDYALYQDQAEQLDILSDRIDGLVKALQVKGVHDASIPELKRLFTEAGNNDLIPVKNWAGFVEKQGLKGAIDIVDLTPIANALTVAYEAFGQLKEQVYEITGIADIIRGATDADETLGAQKMKGQYATLRLRDMQRSVAEFATEVLRIKAQIIVNKFEPETILKIGAADQLNEVDKQLIDPAIQLLKSGLRSFRIDIEADSMVQLDENQEKADRVEFLGAVSQFLEKALQAPPTLAPLLGQLLKFGVTGFKVGKQIEGDIDQAIEMLKKQAIQQAQNPPPNPEMAKVQAQLQGKREELQMQGQFNQQQAQRDMQIELFKQQVQQQQVEQQNQIEAQRQAMEAQHQAAIEQFKQQGEERMAQLQQQIDVLIARLNNAAKVEVAEIAAQTAIDTAQISAANQASGDNE